MSAGEFVRRLRSYVGQADRHYVFWLGAGCSVTSSIPAAASLVRDDWLPQLHRIKGGDGDLVAWIREEFPDYEEDSAGALYGAVMNDLFPLPEERQRETERLCDGRVPGFGYGVLAALMSRDDGFFSAALTTNFDDLIADAMYVFGARRPLVIQHESLAGFVRPGRVRRPLVVKVHGDHRLNPMHTALETEELRAGVADGIRGLLHDRGVIFVGYSGNDRGVIETLEHLPPGSLPLGVWWVSKEEPRNAVREWLDARDAVWVRADGFDELMLLFREEFQIEHPTAEKFDRMITGYRSAYERLSTRVDELPDSAPDAEALKGAARRATEDAPDWWGIELAARRYKRTDPDRADEIYREGVARLPDPRLLGNYAIFLTDVREDHDRAEQFYERAIAAEPRDGDFLGNFAVFLNEVRSDYDRAQEFYERAIEVDPNDAVNLGNYADFLDRRQHVDEQSEAVYERAIAADPNDVTNLTNFAGFLEVRQEYDRAQALYERAIGVSSQDITPVANYARLLFVTRDDARAVALVDKVLGEEDTDLNAEVLMYLTAVGPTDRRDDALASLSELVREGARSPDWDFSHILARAHVDGDPRIEFLQTLADVISERADASELERFEEWPKV